MVLAEREVVWNTLESQLKNLEASNESVRREAAKILGEIGDERAFLPLCKALHDSDWFVREAVIEALGALGDYRAVEPLYHALENRHWYSSESVIKAFVEMGESAVKPLCQQIQTDNGRAKKYAIEALGEIGSIEALETLCATLHDESKTIRAYAATSLAKIGDSNTLPFKVLQESSLTIEQRWKILQTLRTVQYREETNGEITSLQYAISDVAKFCKQCLKHKEEIVRREAEKLLLWSESAGRTGSLDRIFTDNTNTSKWAASASSTLMRRRSSATVSPR